MLQNDSSTFKLFSNLVKLDINTTGYYLTLIASNLHYNITKGLAIDN